MFVSTVKLAEPAPLSDAVSSGVFVSSSSAAVPVPETISSPLGVLVVILNEADASPGRPRSPSARP